MEWSQLVGYVLAAIVGVVAGYLMGTRRARKVKKRVVQQLNSQSMELLDAKASLNQLEEYASKQKRKDRLLKLTLIKLKQANKVVSLLQTQQASRNKKHFIEMSRIRMRSVEARETARRAVQIARKATLHLKRLEKASPVTQTIEAHEPKSYGNGEPVTVSVVDQARLDNTADSIAQVSNRDSARLTKLHSSNEATAS